MYHQFKISYNGQSLGPHQSHFQRIHFLRLSLNMDLGQLIPAQSASNRRPFLTMFLVLSPPRITQKLQELLVQKLVWAILSPGTWIRCYPISTWPLGAHLIFRLTRDWRETMSAPSCLLQPVVPLPLTIFTSLTAQYLDPSD